MIETTQRVRWWYAAAEEVLEVSGPDAPDWGRSIDGALVVMHSNTHFRTPIAAWRMVLDECAAGVALASNEADRLEEALVNARVALHAYASRQRRALERYRTACETFRVPGIG